MYRLWIFLVFFYMLGDRNNSYFRHVEIMTASYLFFWQESSLFLLIRMNILKIDIKKHSFSTIRHRVLFHVMNCTIKRNTVKTKRCFSSWTSKRCVNAFIERKTHSYFLQYPSNSMQHGSYILYEKRHYSSYIVSSVFFIYQIKQLLNLLQMLGNLLDYSHLVQLYRRAELCLKRLLNYKPVK